jgi:integrase
LLRVAAYTGLRQGELRALRWRDVGGDVITVSRALSAGVESGTKGGRVRHVPLVPQAAEALERLRARGDFTTRDELVFCNWRGRALDPSALVARFKRARRRWAAPAPLPRSQTYLRLAARDWRRAGHRDTGGHGTRGPPNDGALPARPPGE